ncbi:MAG TPA: hypothetical protein QF720_00105 [Nitrospinota bacterium]|nr:hypothetical protein [Nitrospinota bacterium]
MAIIYRIISSIGLLHKADAIVIGMMAEDIFNGVEYPLLYYGQFYMGALEAWLLAPIYFFFEPDWWTISFIPIFISTIAVIPFYLLGKSISDKAGGIIAAGLWAISPFAINFYNITPRGCYPEVVLAGALLLWYSTEKIKGKEISLNTSFIVWFFGGLSLWASMLAAPFLATSGLLTMIYSRRRFITSSNLAAICGLIIGGSPFLIVLYKNGFVSLGQQSVENLSEKVQALFLTAKWLFVPYPDMAPGLVLTYGGWFYFLFTVCSLSILIVVAIIMLFRGRTGEFLPLAIFSILFVVLFVINSEATKLQTRYLLPLTVPLFVSAGWLISLLIKKSKIVGLSLAFICLFSSMAGNSLIFNKIKEGNTAQKDYLIKTIEQAKLASVKSLVWGSEYENSYKLLYEARRQGILLNLMPWDGTRVYSVNNSIEADPHTAVWVPVSLPEVVAGFQSCCNGGYETTKIGGRVAVRNIKVIRWPSTSIGPEKWVVHDAKPGINDRKFTTTHHSNKSFIVQLNSPQPVTMIRAIYGRRQPQSISILVSTDGKNWSTVSPKAPASLMVPYGPKVFFRTLPVWEREYQEWNFKPRMAKYIKFEIQHPSKYEYDIHELFIYAYNGAPPFGEGADIRNEDHPSCSMVKKVVDRMDVSLLAANRWHTAKLYNDPKRSFKLALPSLRGFREGSITSSKLRTGTGFAALVDSSDVHELKGWLGKHGSQFNTIALGAVTLVSIETKMDIWFTGFTVIDY